MNKVKKLTQKFEHILTMLEIDYLKTFSSFNKKFL